MWSFLLVLLFILKSRLGTTPSLVEYFSRRYGEEGKRIYRSWWCCKLLAAKRPVCNKVLHTVMWSFLLVLLFILKSRLGTTPSLVEYFSRRYGEEGKRIYRSWWCCKLLAAKRPVCNKVLHTVMWSFLLVLVFILKSRLGTTPSLVEYFSRRYGEEGKRIYRSWWCCKLLVAKRPVCNKVLHTVMWSFLFVLLFILKSRLGTTPSLVEYF